MCVVVCVGGCVVFVCVCVSVCVCGVFGCAFMCVCGSVKVCVCVFQVLCNS